jgi:DNA mismatch repair protein MutH
MKVNEFNLERARQSREKKIRSLINNVINLEEYIFNSLSGIPLYHRKVGQIILFDKNNEADSILTKNQFEELCRLVGSMIDKNAEKQQELFNQKPK